MNTKHIKEEDDGNYDAVMLVNKMLHPLTNLTCTLEEKRIAISILAKGILNMAKKGNFKSIEDWVDNKGLKDRHRVSEMVRIYGNEPVQFALFLLFRATEDWDLTLDQLNNVRIDTLDENNEFTMSIMLEETIAYNS